MFTCLSSSQLRCAVLGPVSLWPLASWDHTWRRTRAYCLNCGWCTGCSRWQRCRVHSSLWRYMKQRTCPWSATLTNSNSNTLLLNQIKQKSNEPSSIYLMMLLMNCTWFCEKWLGSRYVFQDFWELPDFRHYSPTFQRKKTFWEWWLQTVEYRADNGFFPLSLFIVTPRRLVDESTRGKQIIRHHFCEQWAGHTHS